MKKIIKTTFCVVVLLFGLTTINAQQMVEGIHYKTGKPVKVTFKDGTISNIEEINKLSDSKKVFIAPGFFDNQINCESNID